MRDTNFIQQTEEMGLIGGHMLVIWCVEGEVFRECNIKCIIHIMEVFNAKFPSSDPPYQTKEEAPQAPRSSVPKNSTPVYMVIPIHQCCLPDLSPRVHWQVPVGLGSIQLPEINRVSPPILCQSGSDVGGKVRKGGKRDKTPFSKKEGASKNYNWPVGIDPVE